MTRNLFLFLGTFAAGALVALVVRAARHDPHAGHAAEAATGGDYAPMVSNTLAPKPAPTAADHSGHGAAAETPKDGPVNTVCAICGMEVDPALPTEEYQGKKIGFGCRMCPPKFRANPDYYGPFYLRNEIIKRG